MAEICAAPCACAWRTQGAIASGPPLGKTIWSVSSSAMLSSKAAVSGACRRSSSPAPHRHVLQRSAEPERGIARFRPSDSPGRTAPLSLLGIRVQISNVVEHPASDFAKPWTVAIDATFLVEPRPADAEVYCGFDRGQQFAGETSNGQHDTLHSVACK